MRLGQKVVALESAAAAEGERIIASLESIQIDFKAKTEVVSVESRGKLFKGRQTVTVSTEGFFEVIGDILKAIVNAVSKFFNWLFGGSSSSSSSDSSKVSVSSSTEEIKSTVDLSIKKQKDEEARIEKIIEEDKAQYEKLNKERQEHVERIRLIEEARKARQKAMEDALKKKQAEEDAQRQAEEERKRAEELARQLEEEKARLEEERKRQAEELARIKAQEERERKRKEYESKKSPIMERIAGIIGELNALSASSTAKANLVSVIRRLVTVQTGHGQRGIDTAASIASLVSPQVRGVSFLNTVTPVIVNAILESEKKITEEVTMYNKGEGVYSSWFDQGAAAKEVLKKTNREVLSKALLHPLTENSSDFFHSEKTVKYAFDRGEIKASLIALDYSKGIIINYDEQLGSYTMEEVTDKQTLLGAMPLENAERNIAHFADDTLKSIVLDLTESEDYKEKPLKRIEKSLDELKRNVSELEKIEGVGEKIGKVLDSLKLRFGKGALDLRTKDGKTTFMKYTSSNGNSDEDETFEQYKERVEGGVNRLVKEIRQSINYITKLALFVKAENVRMINLLMEAQYSLNNTRIKIHKKMFEASKELNQLHDKLYDLSKEYN